MIFCTDTSTFLSESTGGECRVQDLCLLQIVWPQCNVEGLERGMLHIEQNKRDLIEDGSIDESSNDLVE